MTHRGPRLFTANTTTLVFILLTAFCRLSSAYNISPVPNVVFRVPRLPADQIRNRTYFGMALQLQKSHIFVGAPKASSSSLKLREVREPGAVFRCQFDAASTCEEQTDLSYRGYEDGVIKDGQYFGATLGGLPEEDILVGCAPRMIGTVDDRYSMTGACYTRLQNATSREQRQAFSYRKMYWYVDTALEGFSVHVVRDAISGELELVTGLPGYGYIGSAIFYGGGSLQQGMLVNNTGIPSDSYYGFSISSIQMQEKTLFLVSAPRSNLNSGIVYVFEKVKTNNVLVRMNVHAILEGDTTGEYFGYSLCTADVNGDGLTDVLVGAPYHSMDGERDNGAVYVFINRGLNESGKLQLERAAKITSNYKGSGQFGYAIGALGDINQDGFNDIAIGAPFDTTGAVYIYHGSSEGLSEQPAQVLRSSNPSSEMFGASVSRGMDIDSNEYKDIAVGAPSEDTVYLFKTYPLVRVNLNMSALTKSIVIRDSTSGVSDEISFEVCYSVELLKSFKRSLTFDMLLNITVDPVFRRTKSQNFSTTVKITESLECESFNASVMATFYQLSSPISITLQYNLINQDTNLPEFCSDCVIESDVLTRSNIRRLDIPFKPDCESKLCSTDLSLESTFNNFNSPFAINSSRSLEISYVIRSLGESAYGTILDVTFSRNVSLLKFPAYCELEDATLSCKINQGRPIGNDSMANVTIVMDGRNMDPGTLEIRAVLTSDGNETRLEDNEITSILEFIARSNVEIKGETQFVNLDLLTGNITGKARFLIFNYGPSKLFKPVVSLLIPEGYIENNKTLELFNVDHDSIKISFQGRDIQSSKFSTFHSPESRNPPNGFIETSDSQNEFLLQKKGSAISCYNASVVCRNITFSLVDFEPVNNLIRIEFDFVAFPDPLRVLMNDDLEKLSLLAAFEIGDQSSQLGPLLNSGSLLLYRTIPKIPLWVLVVSITAGIVLLALITYYLHKRHFFRRMTQSDMEEKLNRVDGTPNVAYEGGSIMMISSSSLTK
ncbi:integrin alpha-PS4-like [Uranotaenia lowii]|uniref:integrin alpha-PS4-like n=1 Tax=Uranotaenia lowii TaxID=190385 RepID=UPI00247858B0|nr:integrin alpha-PS4-like [Uranotaenia lowii]